MSCPVDEPGFVEFARREIDQSIPLRFAAQVARHPDRPAVSFGGTSLSYRELDARANAYAHAVLDRLGPGGEAVALLLPQGHDLVAAIMGVLKAGKFYLGLDATYPPARLAEMMGDARARLLVTCTEHRELGASLAGSRTAMLLTGNIASIEDPGQPLVQASPGDLAYVFYTSGTTGRPKGVVDSHRNVLHNVMRYTNTLRIAPTDRMTLLQSASFSGSVSSLFGAILNGACSCPFDPRSHGPEELAKWLRNDRVTIYHSVPALFRHALRGGGPFPDVRIVRLEGDQAARSDLELFARHFSADAQLVNGLGTTETGLVRQFFARGTEDVPGRLLPVGYPVQDMEVSVVDPDGRPVPSGAVGEIAVRSRYLAVGYRENPCLTAQRFLVDPADPEVRTYLTGDCGRMHDDGCLEHLGRIDSRVKLRGQPIELVEVESVLRDIPAVSEAAVAIAGPPENPRLVGYYVPATDARLTVSALRGELSRRLPAFMIPSKFVAMAALPYNENGKLDRGALPGVDAGRPDLSAAHVEPRSQFERELTQVWQEVLGVAPIGVLDDFFELGGDSLSAMAIVTQVRRDLGIELQPGLLLSAPTVAGIADRIAADRVPSPGAVIEIQAGRGSRRFFFLHGDYLSGGLFCHGLAQETDTEFAFWSVPPCGCDGADAPSTFAAMAQKHLEALRAVQPAGPYFLGGVCNGGLIAYEMARRLAADGERVPLLILYAASASNLRFRQLERVVRLVCRLLGYSARHQQSIFLRARQIVTRMTGRSPLGLLRHVLTKSLLLPRELATLSVEPRNKLLGPDLRQHFLAAEDSYIPQPYAGPVLLLWPSGRAETAEAAVRWWRKVAAHVEVRALPGPHQGWPTSEVRLVARELARALAVASGRTPASNDRA